MRQEDQARRVHQDVSLASERLLGCIEASIRSACARCPRRLRINYGSGRLSISAVLLTRVLAQPVVHAPAGQLRIPQPSFGLGR